MKGKPKRRTRAEEERPPEPRWKQQKPAKRRKARKNEAAAPKAAAATAQLGLRPKGRAGAGRTGEGGGGRGGGRGGAERLALRLPAIRITWRGGALLLLLGLLALGGWELFNSDSFYVMQPEVLGNVQVPAEKIVAASDIEGKHILWVRGASVAARVKQLDGIADAAVHVRLPNQVIIEVRERTPFLIWKVGGQEVWVSEDGEPMPTLGTAPALTLTDATAAAAAPAEPKGTGAAASKAGAATVLTVTLRLRPQVLADIRTLHANRPELKDLHYGRREGLYFTAPEGWAVYLGDEGDIVRKLATLQAVRDHAADGRAASDRTPVKVVDLRLEGQAFYR